MCVSFGKVFLDLDVFCFFGVREVVIVVDCVICC